MGRRRGFFAEVQHQSRLAEQRQRANARANDAAVRRAEQAQRAAERARLAADRSAEADRKRLEREATAAYVAARQAEVESLNAALADQYAEIDGVLLATLDVDDYVELESLRVEARHPPFAHEALRRPVPEPAPILDPPAPTRIQVEQPTGLFGKKKKLAEAEAAAQAAYEQQHAQWWAYISTLPAQRMAQAQRHAAMERSRQDQLSVELSKYKEQCAAREAAAREQNQALDELISGLAYGVVDAVQEYIGIVLANSVYPESVPVTHSADFDPSTAELRLNVTVPPPENLPTAKAYRYVKATDEIAVTTSSQKDLRDRYAGLVNAVALRSLHEVFEADRRALFQSVSLEVGTDTINPATGRATHVPFVAVAASRSAFEVIELSAVVPAATLEHLGAVVSKNPHNLTPASGSGIRKI